MSVATTGCLTRLRQLGDGGSFEDGKSPVTVALITARGVSPAHGQCCGTVVELRDLPIPWSSHSTPAGQPANGSSSFTPVSAKCLTLRVIRVRS